MDVVVDEDGFAVARGAGVIVSEAWGASGGVIDVEGAREVEGVVKKWVVAGARDVEGVIVVWWGMNELFTLIDCRPYNSFSTNIVS
jgi:hypothetical protein